MKTWAILLLLLASLCFVQPVASADPRCLNNGGVTDDVILIEVECSTPGSSGPVSVGESGSDTSSLYSRYMWASVCVTFNPETRGADLGVECSASLTCPDSIQRRFALQGLLAAEDRWVQVRTECFGGAPPADPLPTVQPGDVLEALRRVGLPSLEVKIQPEDKTLVNFDTIFYAEPASVTRDLTILGQAVHVEATPAAYLFKFGDGATVQTDTPGAVYPATTIVHRYSDADVTMAPSVDTTYTARFTVNGGAWQDINGTVTIAGPVAALRVVEGTPVLSGNHP